MNRGLALNYLDDHKHFGGKRLREMGFTKEVSLGHIPIVGIRSRPAEYRFIAVDRTSMVAS